MGAEGVLFEFPVVPSGETSELLQKKQSRNDPFKTEIYLPYKGCSEHGGGEIGEERPAARKEPHGELTVSPPLFFCLGFLPASHCQMMSWFQAAD